MEHPAVAEVGVIGKPDPLAGEIVKAFVTLKAGHAPSDALRRELIMFGRQRLGSVAPREVEFDRAPAAHAQRKGDAPAAQGPRARPARGRPLDGGEAVMTALAQDREALLAAGAPQLLRQMMRIRRFEEKCAELYSATKIRGFLHLCIGEEAVAVGVISSLAEGDAVISTYREHGHALARGVPMDAIMAEMFGKVTGCSRGRGGSMHLFDAVATVLRGQRDRGRGHAARGRPGAGRPDDRPHRRDGLHLRRRGVGRGRVPREREPRRPVAPAGAVRAARTTGTRWARPWPASTRRPT